MKGPYETSTVILSHFRVLIWDICFPFEVPSFGIYRNFSLEPQEPFIHSDKCDYYVQDKIWALEHQLLANKNRWRNMSLFQCTSTRRQPVRWHVPTRLSTSVTASRKNGSLTELGGFLARRFYWLAGPPRSTYAVINVFSVRISCRVRAFKCHWSDS